MNNQKYPHTNPTPQGGPAAFLDPPRPAVLKLATWAWVTVTLLFWGVGGLVVVADNSISSVFGLVLVSSFLALFGFGCWKFRLGRNGWRVFFTILSGCYTVLAPFGLFDPTATMPQQAFTLVIGALTLGGLVCSWLPDSNRYFRAAAQHRDAVKLQQHTEFHRNYGGHTHPGWQAPPNAR